MEKIAGKTVGFGFGAGGALAYAKHATTDTMYLLGWDQLPPEALEATRELLAGAWGVVIVLLFMWLGHMMNRAAVAWVNQSTSKIQTPNLIYPPLDRAADTRSL